MIKIAIQWIDIKTKEIIFEDKMSVRKFKRIHGVSPHYCQEGNKKIYQDVGIGVSL